MSYRLLAAGLGGWTGGGVVGGGGGADKMTLEL